MQIPLRSSRWRARLLALSLVAAGASACDSTSPSGSLTSEEVESVAQGVETVANQQVFIDLFGAAPRVVDSPAAAREVSLATRVMLKEAARSVGGDYETAQAAAFPTTIKGKTYVRSNDGSWVWDPNMPAVGTQVVRFIIRNNLGQTRGTLDLTDQMAAGATMRYRAELVTVNNVRVLDFMNDYAETITGTEVSAYSWRVNGRMSDGTTNVDFDYQINESGLTGTLPQGNEVYAVQVPRFETTMSLTGQNTAAGWTSDWTLKIKNTELRFIESANNSVQLLRAGQHVATGTRSQFDGEVTWRTPNGQALDATLQRFVNAAQRVSEALFAPFIAAIEIDFLVLSL
jgi:hypothetical protein